MLTKSS